MNHLNITKASKDQMQRMMDLIRMLEIVAQSQEDFDPRDHLNESDELYKPLMRYFDANESEFDYKAFVSETGNKIGVGMQHILLGYEAMVERFCAPEETFLQPLPNMAILEENEFIVKGALVCLSKTAADLLRSGKEWHSKFGTNAKILSVDASGYFTTHFRIAGSASPDQFPVKSFRLLYNAEDESKSFEVVKR